MLLVGWKEGHLVCKKYYHNSVHGSQWRHGGSILSAGQKCLLSQEGCCLESGGQGSWCDHHSELQAVETVTHLYNKRRYVCLFVCLSVSMFRMAGQTAGPIETKLDTRTHVHPGECFCQGQCQGHSCMRVGVTELQNTLRESDTWRSLLKLRPEDGGGDTWRTLTKLRLDDG